MRELPAGPDAILLDFSGSDDAGAEVATAVAVLGGARASGALPGVVEVVPGAFTVLIQWADGLGVDELGVHRLLRARRADATEQSDTTPTPEPDSTVEIPVVYDGADLEDVATALSCSIDEVVARHLQTRWRVQFMGFAPGFGYLVPDNAIEPGPFPGLGRRSESRSRVPAGSVAVAAEYSAVYPRQSPGGWYLLGRTEIGLWDEHNDPPALLAPGRLVRFVDTEGS